MWYSVNNRSRLMLILTLVLFVIFALLYVEA